MNTPAHAIVNLVALSRPGERATLWPVFLGSIAPDLPMVFFYAWEKLVRGAAEMEIWNERYFAPEWQTFFDIPNSFPILAIALLVAYRAKRRGWKLFFLSMAIHALCDLPLHQEDAHRHFYPLSDWKFISPISYWNPSSGGALMTLVEIGIVLAGTIVLMIRHRTRGIRWAVGLLGASYLAYFAYVLLVWV